MKEERKPEYPEKISDDELQKIPRTTAGKFKSWPRSLALMAGACNESRRANHDTTRTADMNSVWF